MHDELALAASRLRGALDELLAAPILSDPDAPNLGLSTAQEIRDLAEGVIGATVRRAREQGASWQLIGTELGVSRQAAFQRYGKPVDPRTGELMSTTPLATATALAESVISDLAAADWDAVTARFDDAMQKSLSADALAAAWAQIASQAGAYESHAAPEASRAADVTVTNTRLGFEAGEFLARIVFRDDERIAGLFILPPGAP